MLRQLTPEETASFKAWARSNYTPGRPISAVWHPTVVQECHKMNLEIDDAPDDDRSMRSNYKMADLGLGYHYGRVNHHEDQICGYDKRRRDIREQWRKAHGCICGLTTPAIHSEKNCEKVIKDKMGIGDKS